MFSISFVAPNRLVAESKIKAASAPQSIKDFLLAAVSKFEDTAAISVNASGALATGGQFSVESVADIHVRRA